MSKSHPQAQNPLLLRAHRLMEAFAKSDDERDFFLDRLEGFILFVDLDKPETELQELLKEIKQHPDRYCLIPKMTFYETKKFMEGFINEKVYDIDTKEKLLDIIISKEAREHFLEFIYDHLSELEKWQLYYQERSRIRIIEWLRTQNIQFVFEEDLDFTKSIMEKLKRHLFDTKVAKDVAQAREAIYTKSKTYYSNEALNPRPKRGRPPKQVAKVETEPQVCVDLYTTVPPAVRVFLFIPDISNAASISFSAKYDNDAQTSANMLKGASRMKVDTSKLEALSQRLEALRHMSSKVGTMRGLSSNEAEDKNLKTISTRMEEMSEVSTEKPKGKRIVGLAQGIIPQAKAGTIKPLKEKIQKKSAVKTVVSITNTKKK